MKHDQRKEHKVQMLLAFFERNELMSWVLFCQIEVILLTVGLVASFVISMRQTAKDNSFFKRLRAILDGLTSGINTIVERMPKKENQNDE